MKRTKRQLEKDKKFEEAAQFNYCPMSFLLPGEYALFVEEFKRDPGIVWIAKPIGKAQGKGIFLFEKLSDVQKWKVDLRFKPEVEVKLIVFNRDNRSKRVILPRNTFLTHI